MKRPKTKQIRLKGKKYKKLQYAVLRRDDFTCQKCGCYTVSAPHHIKKTSQGGSDIMENMIAICLKCHEKEHR